MKAHGLLWRKASCYAFQIVIIYRIYIFCCDIVSLSPDVFGDFSGRSAGGFLLFCEIWFASISVSAVISLSMDTVIVICARTMRAIIDPNEL